MKILLDLVRHHNPYINSARQNNVNNNNNNNNRLSVRRQIAGDTFTPSFKGEVFDISRCLSIMNTKFLEKIESIPYNELDNKVISHINKVRNYCGKYIRFKVEDNPSEAKLRNTFIGDFEHEFAGSVVGDYQVKIFELGDQNISDVEKNQLARSYAKEIVHYIDKISNLYKFFADNNLDSTTKTIGLEKVWDLVQYAFKEKMQNKNIILQMPNIELFEKYSNETTSDYKNYIIMSNFLSNAIKYSPENSVVKAGIKIKDNELRFFVQDQGIGINPSEISSILKGNRGSNVGDIKGSGYGLNRVMSILDRNPEKIKIISPASVNQYGQFCGTYIEAPLILKNQSVLSEIITANSVSA